MEERREEVRVELNVTVSEKLVSGSARAKAINLSRSGMRYIKPAGSDRHGSKEVFLEFSLAEGAEPIRVLSWVVEETAKKNLLETAVTFMFLPEVDEDKISSYVRKKLSSGRA